MWKVAYANNCSIFYHASTKFVMRFTSKINRHDLSSNGASFMGIKKLQQLWSATQDSCNPLNQLKTGKNPFFRFICPDFWTDLNGCRQRLLFTWQLAQQKCSLCSQGTMVSTREFNVNLIGHSLIWPKQVCAAWQSMVFGLFSKPWTGYESQWCMV